MGQGLSLLLKIRFVPHREHLMLKFKKNFHPWFFVMDACGVLREVRTESLHTRKRSHRRGACDFASVLESVTTVDKWCDHLRRVQMANMRTCPKKSFSVYLKRFVSIYGIYLIWEPKWKFVPSVFQNVFCYNLSYFIRGSMKISWVGIRNSPINIIA